MAKLLPRREVDQNVYEKTLDRLDHIFKMFDHVCVSFSGGKDSTVCLNLTYEAAKSRNKLPLRVFFYDEEAIPFETEDYVRRVAQLPGIDLEWYCAPLKCSNACSATEKSWYPWAPEDEELWVRPLPPEAIIDIPGIDLSVRKKRPSLPEVSNLLHPAEKYGTVAQIMGIRAQESLTRFSAVVRKEKDNYIIPVSEGQSWGMAKVSQGNLSKVYPIYDWKTQDVWTAPKLWNWDYNIAYDIMDKAGITPHAQRVCPAYGEEPIQRLYTYSQCFPDIWSKMSFRVPGAATAMRYSRTELYAFGGIPKKPPDLTWHEFISKYVNRFSVHDREVVAKRLQDEIRAHFRRTSDPILEVPHPLSALSWTHLLSIAMRGDFKKRKQAINKINRDNYQKTMDNYGVAYKVAKGRKWNNSKALKNSPFLTSSGPMRQS